MPGTSGPRAVTSSRMFGTAAPTSRPPGARSRPRVPVTPCTATRRASWWRVDDDGLRDRCRRPACAPPGVLPAAVLSDSGERPLVGPRLHRVDERRAGEAALRRPLSAASAGGPRLLRPACARGARGAGGAGAAASHRRVLLLALLVSRHASARAPVRRVAGVAPARSSVLSLVGERDVVEALARHRRGARGAAGAELFSRRRSGACAVADARLRRRTLHPRARPSVVRRLP